MYKKNRDKVPKKIAEKPGSGAKEIIEICRKYECTGSKMFRFIESPPVWYESKGIIIKDLDGNEYFDLFGGFAVANIGYCHPKVIKAIQEQAEKLIHCPSDFPNPMRAKLLTKLIEIAPKGLSRVAFNITGADANETAMKLAKSWTGRSEFLCFHGGYLGSTHATLAVGGKGSIRKDFHILAPAYFVPFPYCYRCAFRKNYPECDLECLRYIEYIFDNPLSSVGNIAAIIAEPIQGAGGTIVPPDGFLQGLRKICDEQNILLILDEIQTGFGRTGKMWAIEHWNVIPDLLVVGKGIGGGLPVSAVLGKDKILSVWEPGKHMSTFITNAFLHAAAVASIEVMQNEKLHKHAAKVGEYFLRGLHDVLEKYEIVGEIRGKGLLIGIELVKDRTTKKPAVEETKKIFIKGLKNGIILMPTGYYNNVIKISPPLIITKEQIDISLELIDATFKQVV